MSGSQSPNHWTNSTLGQIVVDIEAGKSFRCIEKPPADGSPGIVKVSAVSWGSFNENESKTCPDEKLFNSRHQIYPGDLLMSRANTIELVGACVIVGSVSKRLMLSDKILRIIAQDDLKAWILWYLRSKEGRAQIEDRATGNQLSMRNIGQASILEIAIPLAPDRERLSIVEAIESYLSRLDDAMTTLERVQRNLKRYRASVLKAAVEGRLVPTEAELARAEGREYEPASVLLERVLVERSRRWEEAELAKMEAKGKVLKNDKWKAKYVEPARPDTRELPELPESWCWASFSQLLLRLQTGPFGSSLHKTDYVTGGTPVINPQQLQGFGICPSEKVAVGPDTVARLSSFLLQDGDIVLGRRGEMGRCALVGTRESGWLLGTGSLALKPIESINASFLLWVLRSPLSVATLEGKSVGTTMTNLNQEILYGLPMPLPPCHEQKRIVQEIERHFSLIENLEREVVTQLAKSSCLRQSILKWAFEGRLVDQDPNDEPAEVLLERIRRQAPGARRSRR